jgi:hypothetical protein
VRYHEITSGTRIPVNTEEQGILDLADKGVLKQSSFDERQQEVARNMVSRGLLKRFDDGIFKVSSLDNIERD